MPLFFFLSGYTYKSGKGFYIYIKERVKRLLIPYAAYNLFFITVLTITGYLQNSEQIKNAWAGALYSRYCLYPYTSEYNIYFFTVCNGAMWFLTALFLSSIIFYLAAERKQGLKIYVPVVLILFLGISYMMAKLPVLLPWSLDTAFMGAAFMLCGNLAGRKNIFSPEEFSKKNREGVWIFLTVFYIVLCNRNGNVNMSIRIYGDKGYSVLLFFLIGVLGSMLHIWLCKILEHTKVGHLLCYIGKHTMEILILHLCVFQIIDTISQRWFSINLQEIQMAGLTRYGYGGFKIIVTICICLVYAKIWTYGKERINSLRIKRQ